ncbi:MAG TPA: penicillin-binding protein 1A [Geminicoccaceae bacterium]|nr:penicillin-binding protein 1A [Geminicoccaceae bacterium]
MRRLLRILGSLALGGLLLAAAGGAGLVWALHHYGQELPDFRQLADYQPPTTTRIHAGDGRLLAEYAREQRVFVPIEAIPDRVKQAFVSAEDQNFYHHVGIDPWSIARAAVDNLRRWQDNRRPIGASTITQQVAQNFLLGKELSFERKIKEAVLAMRIERAFSKDRILELYLNEIFLGNRSYGVAAAALNYFDKPLAELTVSEAAFLGGLPKAPSRYDPRRDEAAAIERRGYVIGRMLDDGFLTPEQAAEARAEPIRLRGREPTEFAQADFFTETVRRQLVAHFGESGFYEGGLSVRATVQPRLQRIVDRALRNGLSAYDRRRGWRGPLARIDTGGDWAATLREFDPGFELWDWRRAVVLGTGADGASIGLDDGATALLPLAEMGWARKRDEQGRLGPEVRRAADVVSPGDVIAVEWLAGADGAGRWTLRQRPAVEGAAVVLDPHTGRVLAMTGGFSFRQSQFDRATQARRQPGSAFKPFVYLAALEQGYTPASIVVDAPMAYDQGPGLPKWRPQNYSERYYGPSTLRLGIEKSRNLMTVALAHEIGMDKVVEVARRFGIADGLTGYLASALGSNEVTVLGLTTAYAMLVNGGKQIAPVFVERIQDRHGATVMRGDPRSCERCREQLWQDQLPPLLPDARAQIEDPRLAFQMVSMLEGVVERGTGEAAARLGRPLAGKTGTTNDSKDAWFVGFSPDLVAGVWVGFDQPQPLGSRETGASIALPIWMEIMARALEGQPPIPFRTAPGVSLVRVDAATGLLPGPDTRTIITEAFLPGTEPYAEPSGRAGIDGGAGSGFRAPEAVAPAAAMPGAAGIY